MESTTKTDKASTPYSGTLSNLNINFVNGTSGSGSSVNIIFTLMQNGVATAMSVSGSFLNSGSSYYKISNNSTTISVTEGDSFSLKIQENTGFVTAICSLFAISFLIK